jgi:hypothetical protein
VGASAAGVSASASRDDEQNQSNIKMDPGFRRDDDFLEMIPK